MCVCVCLCVCASVCVFVFFQRYQRKAFVLGSINRKEDLENFFLQKFRTRKFLWMR